MTSQLVAPARELATARAQYLAFARHWETVVRVSELDRSMVDKRLERYFRWLCRRVRPTVVLEIGAHGADFSQWAATTLPQAQVLAFEANPHVHAKYAAKLARTRVDYRHMAVGPVTGDVQLNLPTEVRGRSRSLTSPMGSLGVHTQSTDQVQVTVPGTVLDDCLSLEDTDRVMAWIDVEGANEAVLTGSRGVLDRVWAVYIEVEKQAMWEGQWLDSDVGVFLAGHGLVPVARDVQRRHQYNVVYVRPELIDQPKVLRQAVEILRPEG